MLEQLQSILVCCKIGRFIKILDLESDYISSRYAVIEY